MLHVWEIVHGPGFYISLEIIKVSLGICEVWLVFYAAEAILFISELCTALADTGCCRYLDYGKTLPLYTLQCLSALQHESMLLHGNMYLQFKCLFDATASLLK
uniref:Uncharacterized protein n=1 Tax=Rhipicephalus appendiculatus TaxID=34631 RepID=A0A131YBW6_RHIAP